MQLIILSIYNFLIRILQKYVNPQIGKFLFIIGITPKSSGVYTRSGIEIESCGYFMIESKYFYCGYHLFPIPKTWYIAYMNQKEPMEIYF